MSLKEDILNTLSKVKTSFHMPGHKYQDIMQLGINEIDTTEIEGSDNLHSASSCIKDAEERISKIYHSKKSRIMVSGSSIGLIASIYALSNSGDTILIGRDSHKSVFNACKIANLSYQCVMPRVNEDGLPVEYLDFYDVLMQNPELRLAVITSPNYYGSIRQFKKIADELDKRGGYLIVDEAHGAHLQFTELKNYSALSQGAHISVQSAHKTLPAMTMAAMLHYGKRINNEAILRVDEALRMFQSSSPSYPIMISIDEACSYMNNNRELVQEKYFEFKELEREFSFKNMGDKKNSKVKDPFKVFINSADYGFTGYEFSKILMEEGIYVEFSEYNGVLLYLSIFNSKNEIIEVYKILNTLKKPKKLDLELPPYPNLKIKANNPRNLEVKYEIIEIDKSLGRQAMEDIIPYPPGIPILLKGEIITREMMDYLNFLSELPVGMIEGKRERFDSIKVALNMR